MAYPVFPLSRIDNRAFIDFDKMKYTEALRSKIYAVFSRRAVGADMSMKITLTIDYVQESAVP